VRLAFLKANRWSWKDRRRIWHHLSQGNVRTIFTFKNSPEHIRRFPFPFHEDAYMYAVKIEPHVVGPKGSVLET